MQDVDRRSGLQVLYSREEWGNVRAFDVVKNRRFRTPEEFSGGAMDVCDMLICESENLFKNKKVVDELQNFGARVEKYVKVKKGEVLLGSNTLDFDDVVIKRFNGNSIGAAVVARKGSGKTQLAKGIFVEQIPHRFDRYCAILDPNIDYTALDQPQDDPRCLENLKKLHMKPMMLHPYYCSPKFADIFMARGKKFEITYDDINRLENVPQRMELLSEVLNISPVSDSASYELLSMLINRGIPTQYTELISTLHALSKERAKAMDRPSGSSKIVSLFMWLYTIGILTDNPANEVLFPQMLKKWGHLVLQLPKEGSKQPHPSWIVKYFIKSLITDRKFYQMAGHGEERGVLDKKVMVMVEEAHNFIPKMGNPPSKETIQKLFTTERKNGFDCVLVSQNPEQLENISITQADWLITCKVQSNPIKHLLRERGMTEHEMVLVGEKLYYDQQNKPVQWYLHDGTDSCTFFPYPPCSKILGETTKGWMGGSSGITGVNYNPI